MTAPPPTPSGDPSAPTLTGKRVLVVFNPKSGRGDSELPEFVQLLREAGAEVTERELQKGTPMSDYVQDLESFTYLVGSGGDGTVSSLAYAARYRNVPMLAFPAGTANLIAQNLDLPTDAAGLVDVVRSGHSIRLDMGELEVKGELSGFCMLAGAGVDAVMIKDSEELKERFGAMAYVMSAMKHLNARKTTFHLTIDGQKREFEGIGVMLANFGMANYRLPITTDISPGDGQFTVILMKAGNLARLLPNLIDSVRVKLNLGDPMFGGNLETIEARTVTVDAAEPFPIQYDGELHDESTPFSARILPGAVEFLTQAKTEDVQT
ncbi:diacylglycerol kinase family protein [Deinococcus sp.]|uniref:diacylglycerol/lipid kinase family protein n=1 Tax=Deinococcus sp. TaxID=47478 RepID=UPI0025BA2E91|nr:diacylglycerol kinase family protein [Deinococcus sp.]